MHNGVVVEYNPATKCNRLVVPFIYSLPHPSTKEIKKKQPPYFAFAFAQKRKEKNGAHLPGRSYVKD
jgi:hypothetical protein